MKANTLVTILFLFLLKVSCFSQTNAPVKDAKADQIFNIQDVSIISLIATPDKYDGKHVRVIGFLNLEFEGDALYFHKEDYLAFITKNALWLHINTVKFPQAVKYNKKYVMIEAVFDAKDSGHLGLFSGALKDITRIEIQAYGHMPPTLVKHRLHFPPPKHKK